MDMKDLSVFIMQWGRQPATPAAMIAATRHAEALGFYSVTIPHVPILPYPEERRPTGSSGSTSRLGLRTTSTTPSPSSR